MKWCRTLVPGLLGLLTTCAGAVEQGQTTLGRDDVEFTRPEKHYVVLRRGEIEAVVVDNAAVDDEVLNGHKAGYSGVASLTHTKRKENLFVPGVAGLNFEHIHDGTTHDRSTIFEPRNAPLDLRLIDEHTAELHQPPTPFWGLESCLRYELLAEDTIQMTVECIARRPTFKNGYIGLFWASYIHQPESLDIHFIGHDEGTEGPPRWIRGVTPEHGVRAAHAGADDRRVFPHDADFPMKLVFNRSDYRYDEPWYFGVSHGMAYAQMFRPREKVSLTQSPSGGGQGNPAWDFQWFIPEYEVGRLYRLVMRAAYLPYESAEQVRQATLAAREVLDEQD